MYTLNHVYVNKIYLQEFIQKHELHYQNNLLIQVFSGIVDEMFLSGLINTLKTLLPKANIIGSTTDGEIIDCKVLSKEVVISFSVFEKTEIKTFTFEKNGYSSKELGEKINKEITPKTKVAIIFADGLTTNGEHLVEGIEKNVTIAGGFAGDNYYLEKTYVFSDKGMTDLGCAVALLQSDSLIVNSDYNLNWEGIGKVLSITKADNNGVVYELDNIPVKEVYKKYFGDLAEQYLPEIGMEFPLITVRNGVKIARAVISEKDDSLVYAGNLYEGEEVQFGYASINDILAQDIKMFQKLADKPVESLFVYECMARRRFFSNRVEYEYLPVSNMKMSGFYTYGEFYGGKNKYFFNQTITYLALSESENSKIKIEEINLYEKDDFLVCQALTNLIKSTTLDLKQTTDQLKIYAHTDPLTKILNRKGCFESIKNLNCDYTMLLIDIDHFKEINDRYGHDTGDKVLKGIVDLIKSNIRQNDIFCRYGGEEFLVILPGTSFENGVMIAKKIKEIIETTPIYGLSVTISIGVSYFVNNFYDTFKKADENLYIAKNLGRNRVGY